MKGFVVYTDVGYENKFGEIETSLDNALIYKREKDAIKSANEIWKHRKEYQIEEIGVAEIYQITYTKYPKRLHKFDD